MDWLLAMARTPSLSVPARYALTATVMLVCVALQSGLRAQSGFVGLFLLLPGIFVAGFLFDRGSSLFAAVIAIVFTAFTIPNRSIFEYLAPLVLFTVTALGVALVSEALRSQMTAAVQSERAKSILLQELAHRTRNNLAILSAMIRLQAKSDEPIVAERLEGTSQRIQVLAEVYDHLTLRADAKLVDFRDYLSKVCEKLSAALTGPAPVALTVDVEEIYIPSEQAVPIAIIMNELVTNAFKYAFPDGRAGHIHVAFRAEQAMELTVADNGVGFDGVLGHSGLGSRIIHLLTQQLGATLVYEKLDSGCKATLLAPRKNTSGGDEARRSKLPGFSNATAIPRDALSFE
jgi:two-component sensor histidine kinase